MKWIKDDFVIEADGCASVLENLGYKSQYDIDKSNFDIEKKKKFKKFTSNLPFYDRVCITCESSFQTKAIGQKNCSKKCGGEYRRKKYPRSTPVYIRKEKPKSRNCVICKKEFPVNQAERRPKILCDNPECRVKRIEQNKN